MVYCGKPSGGCHPCRQRKTRCDQRALPEGCTQCERAKRTCPGYRMIGDVIFRNESENVKRKAKAKETRAAAKLEASRSLVTCSASPSEEAHMHDASSDDGLEIVRQINSPISEFPLAPNIEERAAAFFVTNYVINASGPTKGYLDYVSTICDPDEDVGLLSAMKAVGIAGVAHTANAPSLLNNARYHYVKALAGMNSALKSPTLVKKDSTLTAIMILSIYETVTGSNQKSIVDWVEHVKGAGALLKLRGKEQLATPIGRKMFIQIASSLMISCILRDAPLPKFIIDWTTEMREALPEPEPALLSQHAMMMFTQFRAAVHNGKISDPEEIVSRALELDKYIASIFTNKIPSDWEYETVYTDLKTDFIWNGRYHVYYDYWISQIWNGMRSIRIMLNETIRSTLLKGFSAKPPQFTGPEHTTQFQRSTDLLYELQADILATVPQHLGYVTSRCFRKNEASNKGKSSDKSLICMPWATDLRHPFHNEMNGLVRMSGPYFLLWPLWYTGILDISTDELKKFVITNLRSMAGKTGIRQALVLAEVLETKTDITVL